MDKLALLEKMAVFAGYFDITKSKTFLTGKHKVYSNERSVIPDFTKDETACFKWLVPLLWVCDYQLGDGLFHIWNVSRPNKEGNAPLERCSALDENSSALALCLAMEKLIDGEEK